MPSNNSSNKTPLYTYAGPNGDTITVYNDGSETFSASGGLTAEVIGGNQAQTWNVAHPTIGKFTATINGVGHWVIEGNNAGDTLDASGFTGAGIYDLIGGNGRDVLTANNNGAYLDGNNGSDGLTGGASGDTLVGGLGGDLLAGNGGADDFLYRAPTDSPYSLGNPLPETLKAIGNWDIITGFSGAPDPVTNLNGQGDKIDLSQFELAHELIGGGPTELVWYGQQGTDASAGMNNPNLGHGVWEVVETPPPNGSLGPAVTFLYADVNNDGKADLKIQVDGTVPGPGDIGGSIDLPPVTHDFAFSTTDEDTDATGNALTQGMVTDPDGDEVHIASVNGHAIAAGPSGTTVTLASGATITMHQDGTYSYDPSTYSGIENVLHDTSVGDSFTYTAADTIGGISNASTVTVTVNVPAETVTGMDDTINTTTSDDDQTTATASSGVLVNDQAGSDDPLHVSAVTNADNTSETVGTAFQLASGATITLNSDGSYAYDPSTIDNIENTLAGTKVTDTFTYTASDGHSDTADATVTINYTVGAETVTAADDTLTIGTTDDTTTNVDAATGGLLLNDAAGTDDADTLHVATITNADSTVETVGTAFQLASGATITINSDGSYAYDPSTITNIETTLAGTVVPDTFSYTASDGHGDTDTATVTVNYTVGAELVAGTADTLTINTGDDTPTNAMAAGGVLANDTSDDSLTVTAITNADSTVETVGTAFQLASGATITVNGDGSYAYDPSTITGVESMAVGHLVKDTFTYSASDGHGDTGSDITVTVNYTVAAETVTANNDSASIDQGQTLNGTTVLANDLAGDDGDTLQIASVNGSAANVGEEITLGSGATLTVNSDGTYTYNSGSFSGSDSFSYTAVDGHGDISNSANVAITVNPVGTPEGLVFTASDAGPHGDSTHPLGTFSATDPNNETLTFSLTDLGPNAGNITIDSSTGDLTVNASGDTVFTDTITVTATDTDNLSTSTTYNIWVGTNQADGTTAVPVVLTGLGSGTAVIADGVGGNDVVVGTSGADYIVGGSGDDTITGDGGADVMDGGSGNNTYVYTAAQDSQFGAGGDTIADFDPANDKIDLTNLGALTLTGTGQLAGTTIAAGSIGWATDGTNAEVYVNTSGSAEDITVHTDMQIHLTGVTSLTSTDFVHA